MFFILITECSTELAGLGASGEIGAKEGYGEF